MKQFRVHCSTPCEIAASMDYNCGNESKNRITIKNSPLPQDSLPGLRMCDTPLCLQRLRTAYALCLDQHICLTEICKYLSDLCQSLLSFIFCLSSNNRKTTE